MTKSAYVILDNTVLDVTDYLTSATNIVKVAKGAHSRAFALDRMFLPLDISIVLFTNMGSDITPYFHNGDITSGDQYKSCLKELFFHGVVASDKDEGCQEVNLGLWITMGCFLFYFFLKINLANLSRLPWIQRILFKSVTNNNNNNQKRMTATTFNSCTRNESPPFTLLFIPCYAESSETIKQTFDSLARTNYSDKHKLLFFVCDGLAKSQSDGKETYICILESLGYSSTKDPELRSYISLGQGARRINHAKVYAGFYESGRNRVPFLMIVKIGSIAESVSRVPGNRGKRDSMVIVLSFLERCMNLSHNRITPLEFELFNQCYNLLGIDPRRFKYMLVTDADTQVQDDVVLRMVTRLEADPKLLAVNGHIRPANPEENIVTMLQIFPLYTAFYSGLAYEACLGSVATINGGFIMYRLWTEMNNNTTYSQNNTYNMNQLSSHPFTKWAKVSDEIVVAENSTIASWKPAEEDDYDDSSSDDNLTTNTTVSSHKMNSSSRRRTNAFVKTKKQQRQQSTKEPIHVSLSPNKDITPICIQPTVLRGFAAPQADTMHMENILLLGEDQYFSTVLLRSHPQHGIGFESEAIAYATIPSNFFALQAFQSRSIRSTFHTLVEFQYAASHLGFRYWITSFTKLLDMVFSMPIIVYLYTVYIRYFLDDYLVYATITVAFTCLIIVHILFFLVRRQFKYILWFIIYGLFSVPLFSVYFPILAIWCSDSAYKWYDVWPTKEKGYHSRLHGVVAAMDETKLQDEEETVARMRLGDFEILEAERQAQREREQVEMLDAKFNGFTSYVGSHASKPSWSSANELVPTPPLAQTREGYTVKMKGNHSRFASEDDTRFLSSNRSSSPRTSSMNSVVSATHNPFASMLDDPFDDVYAEVPFDKPVAVLNQHKPSRSQSSYFSQTSGDFQYPRDMFTPVDENSNTLSNHYPAHTSTNSIISSSRMRSYSTSSVLNTNFYNRPEPTMKDTDSIISLSNSVISLERDAPIPSPTLFEPQHTTFGGRRRLQFDPVDEGRSAPVHTRIVLQHP